MHPDNPYATWGSEKCLQAATGAIWIDSRVSSRGRARNVSAGLSALVDSGQIGFVKVDSHHAARPVDQALSIPIGATELIKATAARGRRDILVNNVGAVTPLLDGFLGVTTSGCRR